MVTEPKNVGSVKEGRDKKGRFLPGMRPEGAGRKKGVTRATKLAQALKDYEDETGRSFVRHYIETAFEDNATARDIASRLWPALKAVEADVTAQHKILNIVGLDPIGASNSEPVN